MREREVIEKELMEGKLVRIWEGNQKEYQQVDSNLLILEVILDIREILRVNQML